LTLSLRHAGALCAGCLIFAPAAAHAQAFTVTFAPDTQTIFPGQTETFSGTIKNTTANDLYINQGGPDSLGLGLIVDSTPFSNTFGGAPVLLGAGQTYALTDFFTVTDTGAQIGTFTGQFTVYGGADPAATDQSGFQTFEVLSPVPEASSWISFAVLLAGGAAVWAVKRRKQCAA